MAAIGCGYPSLTLTVSPTGDDSSGDGTLNRPFATPGKARDVLRARYLNAVGNVTVNLRAGSYPIASTFTLGEQDSGQLGHTVSYVSVDGPGQAVLDGGVAVTGWTVWSGNIYRAPVSSSLNFWTMYENGVRGILARTPSFVADSGYPTAQAPYLQSDINTPPSNTVLQYLNHDADLTGATLGDVRVKVWPGANWDWQTDDVTVASVNTGTKQLTFGSLVKFSTGMGGSPLLVDYCRYFLQGDLSFLDSPGEWYYDRNDVHGSPGGGSHYLYYYPRNTPIASQTIVVPAVQELVKVAGSSATSLAGNITIDGLALQNTDYATNGVYTWGWPSNTPLGITYYPPNNSTTAPNNRKWPSFVYFDQQAMGRVGAIHLLHTQNVTLKNLHVLNAGMHGVFIEGYGQGLTVQKSWVEKVGHTGILVLGGWPGEGDILTGNTYSDLRVNNPGQLAIGGSGIEVTQSSHNTLTHLDIHDLPRKAVWIVGDFDVSPTTDVYANANTVSYGKFQRGCQDSGDTGMFACTSLSSTGPGQNVNTWNQITVDTVGACASMQNIAPHGILMDDQTYGQVMSNVQVTNVQAPGLLFSGKNGSNYSLTNCNFKTDGSSDGTFNSGLMDYANIGTTAGFPYP